MNTHGAFTEDSLAEGKGREGKGTGNGKEVGAVAPAARYAFAGRTIKLTRPDFDAWRKANKFLDLASELTSRDDWLSSDKATDDDRKNWFVRTSAHLANRNQAAMARASPRPTEPAVKVAL